MTATTFLPDSTIAMTKIEDQFTGDTAADWPYLRFERDASGKLLRAELWGDWRGPTAIEAGAKWGWWAALLSGIALGFILLAIAPSDGGAVDGARQALDGIIDGSGTKSLGKFLYLFCLPLIYAFNAVFITIAGLENFSHLAVGLTYLAMTVGIFFAASAIGLRVHTHLSPYHGATVIYEPDKVTIRYRKRQRTTRRQEVLSKPREIQNPVLKEHRTAREERHRNERGEGRTHYYDGQTEAFLEYGSRQIWIGEGPEDITRPFMLRLVEVHAALRKEGFYDLSKEDMMNHLAPSDDDGSDEPPPGRKSGRPPV